MALGERLQKILDNRESDKIAEEARKRTLAKEAQREEKVLESFRNEASKAEGKVLPILQEVNAVYLRGKGKLGRERIGYLRHPGSAGISIQLSWDFEDYDYWGSGRRVEINVDAQQNVNVCLGDGNVFEEGEGGLTLIRHTNLSDTGWKEKVEDMIVEGIEKDSCYYSWETPDIL